MEDGAVEICIAALEKTGTPELVLCYTDVHLIAMQMLPGCAAEQGHL